MSLVPNKALEGASGNQGYNLQRSLRFRSSASAYLSRTPASAGNQQKWTWSGWVKRGTLGSIQSLFASEDNNGVSGNFFGMRFVAADQLQIFNYASAYQLNNQTSQVFRDPSAWYHIILSVDTTQATAANRVILYVNGSQVTAYASTSYPAQNTNLNINDASHKLYICAYGTAAPSTSTYFDGYLAEVNFIDGQALTPSSFGQTDAVTGVWTPKKYTGTYGTNGFYLPFSDNTSATTLAYDKSGNGNNWTPNNISTTAGSTYDSMLDVPTLTSATAANFATLNPLMSGAPFQTNAAATVSQGNLQADWTTTGQGSLLSTVAMTSGKWYFEGTVTGTNTREVIGIVNSSAATTTYVGGDANGWGYFSVNGNKYNNGAATAYGATYTTNDIIGVAFDADAGSLTFYKNGTSQGTAFTGLSAGTYFFAVADANSTYTCGWNVNFGQRPFSYTPPTGFKALNTFNLPDPTIKKPNQYMDATTYTGNGSSVTVSGKFQPDLMWFKRRSGTAQSHRLFDSARGNSTILISDSANGDNAGWVGDYTPTSDGFTVATGSGLGLVANAETFVGWQWKKGATPGFDIVTYTGTGANANISHSLGVAPKMIIVKSRSIVSPNYGWQVQHTSLGATKSIVLNSTSAALTSTGFWNDTAPTSSVFTVGNDWDVNKSAATYVAYLFAEIAGFSKAFSYTGNGSADGPMVWCGFQPRFILQKRTDSTGDWRMIDTARGTYNVIGPELQANQSAAEYTGNNFDVLSNGFKLRSTGAPVNASGGTYIGMAFASNPFKYSNAF